MKIDFNGIIDLEIPGDDELATVYDKVKATMQKEDTFDLMEAIKERTEKMEAQLEKPYILITDKKVSTMKELMGVLEPVAQNGRALLIIAEDVDGEALSALVVNKLRGTLKIAAVRKHTRQMLYHAFTFWCGLFGDRTCDTKAVYQTQSFYREAYGRYRYAIVKCTINKSIIGILIWYF